MKRASAYTKIRSTAFNSFAGQEGNNSMKQFFTSLAVVLAIQSGAPVQAAEVVDRVVATVNGDAILLSELSKAREDVRQENVLAGRSESLSDREILQRLIEEKLADQEARKLNIEVTDREIDGAIQDVLRQYGLELDGLKARLLEQGIEFDEYRRKIEEQIRRMKLTNRTVRSRVVIDQNRMQAYYSEHRDDFREEPKVHLKQLVFQGPGAVENANKLYEEKTLAPEELAKAAEELKGQVIDLGIIRVDRLNLEFAGMVRELEPGHLAPPFQGPMGVQMLYLEERMPSRVRSFEEVKTEIEDRLGREETERQFAKWLAELKDDSLIEIKL
jgi:parvulin-like peptidyl-prolyl isomerase